MYIHVAVLQGDNMAMKIADFGFSEKMYMRAYVQTVLDGVVKLPVKWMAPESICYGLFSVKSDVVRASSLLHPLRISLYCVLLAPLPCSGHLE